MENPWKAQPPLERQAAAAEMWAEMTGRPKVASQSVLAKVAMVQAAELEKEATSPHMASTVADMIRKGLHVPPEMLQRLQSTVLHDNVGNLAARGMRSTAPQEAAALYRGVSAHPLNSAEAVNTLRSARNETMSQMDHVRRTVDAGAQRGRMLEQAAANRRAAGMHPSGEPIPMPPAPEPRSAAFDHSIPVTRPNVEAQVVNAREAAQGQLAAAKAPPAQQAQQTPLPAAPAASHAPPPSAPPPAQAGPAPGALAPAGAPAPEAPQGWSPMQKALLAAGALGAGTLGAGAVGAAGLGAGALGTAGIGAGLYGAHRMLQPGQQKAASMDKKAALPTGAEALQYARSLLPENPLLHGAAALTAASVPVVGLAGLGAAAAPIMTYLRNAPNDTGTSSLERSLARNRVNNELAHQMGDRSALRTDAEEWYLKQRAEAARAQTAHPLATAAVAAPVGAAVGGLAALPLALGAGGLASGGVSLVQKLWPRG